MNRLKYIDFIKNEVENIGLDELKLIYCILIRLRDCVPEKSEVESL